RSWFIRRHLHLHADPRQPAHYYCLAARCSERSNRESWHGFSASVSTRSDRLLRLRLDRIVRRRALRANHDDRNARRVGLGARGELATSVAEADGRRQSGQGPHWTCLMVLAYTVKRDDAVCECDGRSSDGHGAGRTPWRDLGLWRWGSDRFPAQL